MIRPASILLWALLMAGTDAYQFTLSATTEGTVTGVGVAAAEEVGK